MRQLPSARKERLAALEEEQDEAQAALSRLSADFRAQRDKERPTPDALAKALPEGTVLVVYLFHGSHLSAFVHRRGQKPVRISLGPAAPILEAVREWRPLLSGRKPGGKFGARLKKLVLDPLEKHLEGCKVLLVSPDGLLGTVPFAALPGKKPGSYLIEDMPVAAVPVPAAIPDLMKPVKPEDRLKPALLAVGDLRYDPGGKAAPRVGPGSRAVPRSGRERFGRLPATRDEVLSVRGAFADLFEGGESKLLRDGEATKAAVLAELPKARYAHFATHGFFVPEPKGEWHPLLLSGVALSDANRLPKEGEEDGILTALEVSEMDLTKLELAVLSACETGLGKVAGGEGVLGMQRAFQAAGACSVIASLWKVDDKATQQLMQEFYAAAWDTRKVVSRAEALRAAQLSMLRDGVRRGIGREAKIEGDRLPPYWWGAFVLSGDWR
ncbi:MAG: CHAT domain-containing protein [Gemmataceae bacterium]|nr:CHAT domain-containing protein [Gemmataceae bacterium]